MISFSCSVQAYILPNNLAGIDELNKIRGQD